MPRYFFHIHDDVIVRDDEGLELSDREAAARLALAAVREMMAEEVKKGRLRLGHWIEVEDEQGKPVLSLSFAEAVTIER